MTDAPDTRPTPTVEDYLGVIYTLERDGEAAIGARLAEWLEVSAPTVTATLKRMIRDGWVTMNPGKEVHLTLAGRAAAVSLIRRHMLTELLLARLLGVPWSRVHREADEMEHTISGETMNAIHHRLDGPERCPHGNPLPGHEGLLDAWVPLSQVEPGRSVRIQRIHESAEARHEVMVFLETHGLMPGAEGVVEEVIPFNETLSLRLGGQLVVLGFAVAAGVFVEPID